MACKDVAEATAWLESEVAQYKADFGIEPEEALHIIKVNIGYMAGYYDEATGEKIYRLFGAAHPIFGREKPTAAEAFTAGQNRAELEAGGTK